MTDAAATARCLRRDGMDVEALQDLGATAPPETIEHAAERKALKQGRRTPKASIPVVEPEWLLEDQPPYDVPLAWNFADEIVDQQAQYRRRGGSFALPVPTVVVQ